MVAVCAIKRAAFSTFASMELSRAFGSYSPSMDTAVRSTSMGDALRHLPEKLDHFLGYRPVANQLRLQRVQFRLLGQLAVPKQVDHFLKRRVIGQGVDVITLVTEDSQISIDETDIRLGGNNPLESRLCNWH